MLALRGGVSIPAMALYLIVCLALTWLLVFLGVTPTAVMSMFSM